jgi:predicted amidohydrolase
MSTVRIAVASTPLTATLDEAIPVAIAAIEAAAEQGARIVCLPETGLPGHRSQARTVPGVAAEAIDAALAQIAAAARRTNVAVIVGAEYPTPAGREIRSYVFDETGAAIGAQVKTQIDPSEEPNYVPGAGRRVFTAFGLTFGIAICHEAFRYPEISRSLALAGARVIFVPHYVTTDDGSLPTDWCGAKNPYNEKALLCRALENTVYVAAANNSGPDQGAITGIVSPEGALVANMMYGCTGVAVADVEVARASAFLARRWAPERNRFDAREE